MGTLVGDLFLGLGAFAIAATAVVLLGVLWQGLKGIFDLFLLGHR